MVGLAGFMICYAVVEVPKLAEYADSGFVRHRKNGGEVFDEKYRGGVTDLFKVVLLNPREGIFVAGLDGVGGDAAKAV